MPRAGEQNETWLDAVSALSFYLALGNSGDPGRFGSAPGFTSPVQPREGLKNPA